MDCSSGSCDLFYTAHREIRGLFRLFFPLQRHPRRRAAQNRKKNAVSYHSPLVRLAIFRIICQNWSVRTLQETVYGQIDPFAATQWSVILAAGRSKIDAESSRAALGVMSQ